MSQYKLIYFDGRGLGEISRLIFAAAGVEYEDFRIQRDQMPAFKPKTPFGQLPILEVDGVTLCQSLAIARFLARRFKLAGHTDLEEARADMIVDCFTDVAKNIHSFLYYEQDEDKKEAARKKFLDETLPTQLDNLEKMLKTETGFFVGDSITWADIGLIPLYDLLKVIRGDDQIDQRPKLRSLRSRVQSHPKIAEWLAKRPETVF